MSLIGPATSPGGGVAQPGVYVAVAYRDEMNLLVEPSPDNRRRPAGGLLSRDRAAHSSVVPVHTGADPHDGKTESRDM